MAIREYVGARYVPKFSDVNGGNWSSSYSYESLIIVKYGNDFYTSKKEVPVGIDISDNEYWALTGNYNGAISTLQDQIDDITENLSTITSDVDVLKDKTNWYYPEAYGAVGDGVHDDTQAIRDLFYWLPSNGIAVFTKPFYKITDSITLTRGDIRVTGLAKAEYAPTLQFHQTSGNAFILDQAGISFNNLIFQGPGKTGNTLVLFGCNADTDERAGNIDADFRDCGFYSCHTGIVGRGRNIGIHHCLFSTLTFGVRAMQTAINTDNRGYVIESCRFHDVNICMSNDINNNLTNKNVVINSNFCDYVGTLYAGKGGGVFITDNIISMLGYGANPSAQIIMEADIANDLNILNVISNNIFIGKRDAGYGINMTGGNTIIENNVIQNTGNSGIVVLGNSYAIIKNNILNNSGTNYPMQFGPDVTGIVKYNTFSNCDSTAIAGGGNMTISDNDSINP